MDMAKDANCDKSSCHSLDIFLFNNGQEQTPPRKHHLTVNDLNKWEATLKALAQSQYGTTQLKIDLYTVDGQRVATPIEVINHNTYVAVLPQDEFIPAGYTDYLLQASRSREKRLGKMKKLNNICPSQLCKVTSKLAAKEDINHNKFSNDSGTGRMTSSSGDQPISIPQSQTSTTNSTAKLLHRKNNNSTLLRKNNSNTPNSIIPRTLLKSKDNLSKKILGVSTGRVVNKDPVLVINHNNPLKTKTKLLSKVGKDSSLIDTQKKTEDANGVLNLKGDKLNVLCEKNCLTDSGLIENIIDDKGLIVFENPGSIILDADKTALIKQTLSPNVIPVMPVIEGSKNTHVSKDDTNLTIINNCVEYIYNPDTTVNNESSSKNENKIKIGELPQNHNAILSNIALNKPDKSDNFVTLIDKGDVIKLNLNIEVSKAGGMISAHYNTDTNQLQSLQSLAEKSSQVEIDEIFVQSIEKKSHITNTTTECVDENTKTATTMHCSCYDHRCNEIWQKINTSVNLGEKQYIVLLSTSDFVKKMSQSNHDQEMNAAAQRESRHLSTSNPIKKVFADTALLKIIEKDDTPLANPYLGFTDSQVQSSSKNIQEDENRKSNINDNELFLSEANINNVKTVPQTAETELFENKESLIVRKNASNVSRQFVDNYTQTEWTSMLLEARLHDDDGRYSFHFPPLQVLKCYSL